MSVETLRSEQIARKVGFDPKHKTITMIWSCVFPVCESHTFPPSDIYHMMSAGCMLHFILFVELWYHFIKQDNEVDVSHNLIMLQIGLISYKPVGMWYHINCRPQSWFITKTVCEWYHVFTTRLLLWSTASRWLCTLSTKLSDGQIESKWQIVHLLRQCNQIFNCHLRE